jgi:RNA polymerase sigma-70 factor (ECF subfamily)
MGKSDHITIQAILAGDKDAYRVLVAQNSRSVFRVAYRITGNEADAEDVVQEAFLRGYCKLDRFESRANFSTWIYRIAVRCAFDKIGGRHMEAPGRMGSSSNVELQASLVVDRLPDPERLMLSGEIGAIRELAMRTLTPMERVAFTLRHMEDCSLQEIALALDIDPNAAKQAIYRAVHKLRQRLAPLKVRA